MSLGQTRASQAEAILSQISGGGAAAAAHLLQGQLPFNGQGYHGLHGLPTAASLMPLSAEAQPVVPPVPLGAQPQHAAATARSPPSEPMDAEPAASSSSLAAELAPTLAAQCAQLSKQLALQTPSAQMLTSVIGASGMHELFSGVTDEELQHIIGDLPDTSA